MGEIERAERPGRLRARFCGVAGMVAGKGLAGKPEQGRLAIVPQLAKLPHKGAEKVDSSTPESRYGILTRNKTYIILIVR
jgi:hypothetical protein